MAYVDGYVIAVPVDKKEDYRAMATLGVEVFKDHGAINVVENWGEDVPEGKVTSFSMAVKRKDDEAIVFSWVIWTSKEARNNGMKAVMEDPRMDMDPGKMPFDGQRMIFGGFETLVEG